MSPIYIITLIGYYSAIFNIDPKISLAVVEAESNFKVNLIGSKNERGLFQLMPQSFPKLKLKDLQDPETNIREGIKYLAWNKKYCPLKEDIQWVICWNYGIQNAKKVKHPKLFPYYKKIKKLVKGYKEV